MADEAKKEPKVEPTDATRWHVVRKGETLSKIAAKYYGDPLPYNTIFEANKDGLRDPNIIRIGQKLRIP